jgi:hypothetical protein
MVGWLSWPAKDEGKEQRSREVTRKRTKQGWKERFIVSPIGEHSAGLMPSRTKEGRVEINKERRKRKTFDLKDVPCPLVFDQALILIGG